MSRKINFTISDIFRSSYNFEILIDGSTARCKAGIFFPHHKDKVEIFSKTEGSFVEVSDAQLAELDALEIFSWEKEYVDFSKGTDGIWWSWARFMDWLGEIFKEDSAWIKI